MSDDPIARAARHLTRARALAEEMAEQPDIENAWRTQVMLRLVEHERRLDEALRLLHALLEDVRSAVDASSVDR